MVILEIDPLYLVTLIPNPRSLGCMASYDLASTICQALARG